MGVNKKSEGYILLKRRKAAFCVCVCMWNDWGDVCSDDKIKRMVWAHVGFWLACFYAGGRT